VVSPRGVGAAGATGFSRRDGDVLAWQFRQNQSKRLGKTVQSF